MLYSSLFYSILLCYIILHYIVNHRTQAQDILEAVIVQEENEESTSPRPGLGKAVHASTNGHV